MSSDNDFLPSSDDDNDFVSSDEEDRNEREDRLIERNSDEEFVESILNIQSSEESEDDVIMPMTKRAETIAERQDMIEEVVDEDQEQQLEIDSEDFDQEEDEQQLKDERGAFDRTSGKHTLLLNCGKYKSNSLSELGIKIREVDLTDQEKIACMISYIQFNNPDLFSQSDTNAILDLVEDNKIPSIDTKNALGLMLGYYINPYVKKKKLNKRFNNESLRVLMEKENYNITYPDLIRYGRLWSKIL